MAEKDRKGLRAVEENDLEEYKQKLRKHRRKHVMGIALAVLAVLAAIAGIRVFLALRHYESFDIRSSTDRSDTESTRFEAFQGNILKYNNDGAFYINSENELIWNQPYEMSSPQTDICEDYLAIYDKKGTMIYILTSVGLQGSIETTMPISQVCVASQGVVAVLMHQDSIGYFLLYDKGGNELASGEIHGENGGYPIAIALSHDAVKVAISMLDINEASIKSTIAFYNYGSVGQNEIDNFVGASSYDDMIFPELEFVTDDRMVAFGDSAILLFEGTQKPQQTGEIALEKQARSIFHNDSYMGVVTSNDEEKVTYHLTVYDTGGKLAMEEDFDMDYQQIGFLPNNEICILNGTICDIYTLKGIYKFHYEFPVEVYLALPGMTGLHYTFVLRDETEKVRLKIW